MRRPVRPRGGVVAAHVIGSLLLAGSALASPIASLAACQGMPATGLVLEAAGCASPGRLVLQSLDGGAGARLPVALSPRLQALLEAAAQANGHEVALLRAMVEVESRADPQAVSPKGAIGLMQLMPGTAAELGVAEPQRALFDPETNLKAGARYLRQMMDTFADRPELAIAAYNAGPAAVLRHGRDIPPYPETRAYVRKVLALYERYRAAR
jgi:hypothetical protein